MFLTEVLGKGRLKLHGPFLRSPVFGRKKHLAAP
jgi:hypothetical protein